MKDSQVSTVKASFVKTVGIWEEWMKTGDSDVPDGHRVAAGDEMLTG